MTFSHHVFFLVTKDDSVFKYSDISDDELVRNEKIAVPNDR